MQYRGKEYSVVQGINPGIWKWTVRLTAKQAAGRAVCASSLRLLKKTPTITWHACHSDFFSLNDVFGVCCLICQRSSVSRTISLMHRETAPSSTWLRKTHVSPDLWGRWRSA